jgi:hypothetical protein
VGLLLATEPGCVVKARVAWVGKADPAQAGQAGFEFLNLLRGPVCEVRRRRTLPLNEILHAGRAVLPLSLIQHCCHSQQ